jgi:CBS domain-containing protein
MVTSVVTVSPETSLREVAVLLAEHGFSGLPVVGSEGEVIGVVSEADILHKERMHEPDERGHLARALHIGGPEEDPKHEARKAGDAMTSPAVVISPDAAVSKAATLMLDRKINRLPVVERGKLVGIVSRADLIRAFARPDSAVEQDIAQVVAYQAGLWNLRADSLAFSFADGDVVLKGEVDVPDQIQELVEAVGEVPGVISVKTTVNSRFKE